MKKLIYTFSFVALISIAGKAQTDKPAPKSDAVKNETAPAPTAGTAASDNVVKDEKVADPKNPGTRMAINQKGVPATKIAKDKSSKDEKGGVPARSGASEKK